MVPGMDSFENYNLLIFLSQMRDETDWIHKLYFCNFIPFSFSPAHKFKGMNAFVRFFLYSIEFLFEITFVNS